MATRHISNTLTRWHKVVDRIKTAVTQLSGQIGCQIGPVNYNNLAVLKVERTRVANDTEAALAKVGLLMKLNATLGQVREALARANVEKGVSALLAEQVCRQNQKALYEGLAEAASSARLQLSDADAVLAESGKGDSAMRYRETHTFSRVPEATVIVWRDQAEAIGRELTALSDKISDVNASRLSIELDEEVLAHLGM